MNYSSVLYLNQKYDCYCFLQSGNSFLLTAMKRPRFLDDERELVVDFNPDRPVSDIQPRRVHHCILTDETTGVLWTILESCADGHL